MPALCITPVKGYKKVHRENPKNPVSGLGIETFIEHHFESDILSCAFYILLYARTKCSLMRKMRRASSSVNLDVMFVILPSDFRYSGKLMTFNFLFILTLIWKSCLKGHLDRHKRSTAHLSMLEVGGPGIAPQRVATVSEIDSPPPPPLSSHQVFIRRALENATLQSHFGHLPWAAPPIQRTPPSTSVGFVNHIDPPSPSSP